MNVVVHALTVHSKSHALHLENCEEVSNEMRQINSTLTAITSKHNGQR